MNWGNEAKDFGEAFAAASRGRWKSKSDRELQAIQLEEAKLRLQQLRQQAEDYPGDKAYTARMRALEEQIRILTLKAAQKDSTEGSPDDDPGMKSIKPMQLPSNDTGPPAATHVGLAGGYANDYLEQPGEAAKSYTSPVDGTFAGKVSNRFHAARSGGKREHSGVDLNAKNGAGVYAPIGGTVLSIGYDPGGYDHYVVLMGNDGYIQRIANHGAVRVHRGDDIRAGDLLGVVARGHVHWEIIPPNSPAYRALASGGRASTQSYRGRKYPTINPADFLDLRPGTPIRAGKPFHLYDGQLEASAGPDSKITGGSGTDTQVGGDAGEQLNDFNMRGTTGEPVLKGAGYGAREGKGSGYIDNPEMPGGDYQEVSNRFEHGRSLARLKMGEEGRDTRTRIRGGTDVFGPPGTVDRTGIPYYGRGGTDVLGETGRTGASVWDGLPFNIIEDRASRGRAYDAPFIEDRASRGRAFDAPVIEDRASRFRDFGQGTDVLGGGIDRTGARPAPPGGYGGGTNVLPGNPPDARPPPPGGYGDGTDVLGGGTDRTGTPAGIPTPVSVKSVAAQGVDDFAQRTGRTGSPTNRMELPDPSGARLAPSGARPSNIGRRMEHSGGGFGGGGGDTSLAGGTGSARRGARGLTGLSNEDRQAIMDVSTRFGISPADLTAVIGYETIGTYNPDISSPTGYRGLIQFGPNEQKKYGYKRGMSFADQVRGPVAAYLEDRGLRPGMGLPELYSIINAGSLTKQGLPRWGAADSNGDLRYHIKRITDDYMPGAQVLFKSYGATDIGNATAVGYEGKPVPTPRPRGSGVGGGNGLESDTSVPTPPVRPTPPPVVASPVWDPLNPQRTSTTPTPLAPPSSGSPFDPITPVSPASISPSLAFASGSGFGNAAGRTGAFTNRLELPTSFMARGGLVRRPMRRMAAGGIVAPYSDIEVATGRTGNPQTGGEIPGGSFTRGGNTSLAIPTPGALVTRSTAGMPGEHLHRDPPPTPGPAADDAPDMSATDGPDIQPGDDSITAGAKVVADQGVKAFNGGTTPDPADYDVSGAAATTGPGATGGAGGDVLAGGGESPPGTPEPGAIAGGPAGDAVGGAPIGGIPTPSTDITWDELPRPQKGDPDMAAYITKAEDLVDPNHQMGESARHLAAIGRMYKLFSDRGQTEAAERAARTFVNYLYSGYNQFAAISEAAIESGNIDDGVEAGIRAWNFIPSGRTVTYSKDPNGRGYLINITDDRGAVVHNHMYTPAEIAAKALDMTPGTFWRQIVEAGGGHMPSDAYYKVKDLVDRSQPVPPELMHGLKPEETKFFLDYQAKLASNADAQTTRDKTASEAAMDKEVNDASEKDPNFTPSRAQLAKMSPGARASWGDRVAGVETAAAKTATTAAEQKALAGILANVKANNYEPTPDDYSAAAKIEGGSKAVNDLVNEHANIGTRDQAAKTSKLANEKTQLDIDKAAKDAQDKQFGPVHVYTPDERQKAIADIKDMADGAADTRFESFDQPTKNLMAALAFHLVEYNADLSNEQALDLVYSAALPGSTLAPVPVDPKEGGDPNSYMVDKNNPSMPKVRIDPRTATDLGRLQQLVKVALATPQRTHSGVDPLLTGKGTPPFKPGEESLTGRGRVPNVPAAPATAPPRAQELDVFDRLFGNGG